MSETAPREESATEGAPFAPRVEQPLAPRVEQPLAARAEQPLAFREDMPVPESWGRTLWEVAKPLPLSLGLMYGLQTLVMPGDETFGLRWYLTMGGFFFAQGVFQRRKGTFHSQPMLAFGGLITGVSVFMLGAGLFSREIEGLGMGVVFAAFGVITLIAGFRARALERERAARLEKESVDSKPIEGAMPLATLRERMQRFRERMSKANKKIFAGFASVLGLTMGTLTFGEKLGLSDPAYMGVFFLFWAGLGGMMWFTNHATRKAAREERLECPACNRPLVSTLGSQRLMAQLEDLGRCPQCAARITLEVL